MKPIPIRDLRFLPRTVKYFKYNDHKHETYIEQAFRFHNDPPIYFMRCALCRDLFVWGDS